MLFTPFNVRGFIHGIGRDNSALSRELLEECVLLRMQRGHRCHERADKDYYLGNKKLRRRFEKAVRAAERKAVQKGQDVQRPQPPESYLFKLDREFLYGARHFLRWADRIFEQASNESGRRAIHSYISAELLKNPDYDALLEKTFFDPKRLNSRLREINRSARHTFSDEQRNHVQYASSLGGEYFLVRILTSHGMKIAAEKASNCLYSPMHPKPAKGEALYPHRRRVLEGSRYGYYQVRDGNNDSVASIALDFKKAQYSYEGNRHDRRGDEFQAPVLPEHQFLIAEWERYFAREFPTFNDAKPYGTRPHFISAGPIPND